MGVLNTDYPLGGAKLSGCLRPEGLIDRDEFSSAISAGVKARCENMSEGVGGCSDTALVLSKEEQRKKEVERFKKRFFQLHSLTV